MRLIAEVDADEFERIASGEQRILVGRIEGLVVRQGDGLLEEERHVAMFDPITESVAKALGLAAGADPAIRVYLRGKEEPDG